MEIGPSAERRGEDSLLMQFLTSAHPSLLGKRSMFMACRSVLPLKLVPTGQVLEVKKKKVS